MEIPPCHCHEFPSILTLLCKVQPVSPVAHSTFLCYNHESIQRTTNGAAVAICRAAESATI